jgi:hypothetical protein
VKSFPLLNCPSNHPSKIQLQQELSMNIEQAKTVPLTAILDKLGITPQRKTETDYWYLSPFRKEKTASFKVHLPKNIWYDFGENIGGDVIAFVTTYLAREGEAATCSDALRWIGNMCGDIPRIAPVETHDDVQPEPKLKLISAKDIKHPALEKYLEDRGIRVDVAKHYLQEVRVKNKETGSSLFALGLLNEDNGYELRNSFFKGCVGKKSISVIRGKNPSGEGLHMFEGVMDFLSIVTDLPDGKLDHDAIVLNSLSCLGKASAYIHRFGYSSLWTWMDNDEAGQKAKANIQAFVENEAGLSHYPMNDSYKDFKDVNEWHVHNLKLRMEG